MILDGLDQDRKPPVAIGQDWELDVFDGDATERIHVDRIKNALAYDDKGGSIVSVYRLRRDGTYLGRSDR